jgi:hypothetical protein
VPLCSRSCSAVLLQTILVLLTSASAESQPLWTRTGSLNQPRLQTTGTLLNDGRVLLVGSLTCDPGCYSYPTAEVFDPLARIWTPTGPLHVARFNHVAVALPDGKVLIAGGYLTPGILTATCEIFDPVTGLWTMTGSLSTPRQFHRAVALANGKVLVVGGLGMNGQGSFATLNSAELYDPVTGQWSPAGSLATARFVPTVTLLADGRVLVAGGGATAPAGQNGPTFASAELYDPAANGWSAASDMSAARTGHAATLLADGRVLVAGGTVDSGASSHSAELYDPTTNQWAPAARMRVPRARHTMTLLPSGEVLAVGGSGNWVVSEIYDPARGTWSPAPELNEGRVAHSATLLKDGVLLVAGGVDSDGTDLTSSELLDLALVPFRTRLRGSPQP